MYSLITASGSSLILGSTISTDFVGRGMGNEKSGTSLVCAILRAASTERAMDSFFRLCEKASPTPPLCAIRTE